MVFRRRSTPESYTQEVVEALEKTKLDPETTLVMGGAALALAGIRRAGDLDLMVPYSVYGHLLRTRRLPNGLPLHEKPYAKHPFLETIPAKVPAGVMAVDLTHPHDNFDHHPSPALDQAFLRQIASFDRVEGFAFLPPELVAAHKEHRTGMASRKDRQDLKLIRQHLHEKGRR